MKKTLAIVLISILFSIWPAQKASAYRVTYKEEWYRLYHIHYQQYPDDIVENIYWLEKAAGADFCNPLYTGANIQTEKEWEKYRYLFQMHINLKLIEQHIRLGSKYDKKNIYFYDAPWKDEYLRNLELALGNYKAGYYYWQEAKVWYEKADTSQFNFLYITAKQNWEDERERIRTGELDYGKMLEREIARVEKNIEELKSFESKSY